ncbi:MAG: hypothetical protein ACJAS9_002124 [Polaribacter sp.]
MNGSIDQNAWLFTFSEPKLMEYVYRIEKDLPDIPVVFKHIFISDNLILESEETQKQTPINFNTKINSLIFGSHEFDAENNKIKN